MMCKNPYVRTPTGIKPEHVVLSSEAREASTPFPCGKCLHCKINKSRVWAHRIVLECITSEKSCFVTLTYDEKHIPDWESLKPDDVTKFLKRIRKTIEPNKLRYFYNGEYGDLSGRPHYHLCLFGIGNDEYGQKAIKDAWSDRYGDEIGIVHIGELNSKSAQYVSGYVTKGLSKADIIGKNYSRFIGSRKLPEFQRMSRRPAIGSEAIRIIAERLAKSKYYRNDKVIRELTHGKKKKPLGRFLTKKLSEYLGTKQSVYDKEYWNYQKELFDKHLKEGEIFIENVLREKEGERRAQEGRYKFFRKRKVLHENY